jgi:subtilisin family serine protease
MVRRSQLTQQVLHHITALLLLPTLLMAVVPAMPAMAQESVGQSPVTQLVQFHPAVTEAERDATITAMGGALVSWLPALHVAEVALPAGAVVAADAFPSVVYSEPDAAVVGGFYIPADPDTSNPNRSYAPRLLGAFEGWDISLGSSDVIIAVLDTGVDLTHPEFAGKLVPGYDFVNNDDDPSDDFGHGTHVAGIAAAAVNGAGMVGLCPSCKLMPVKVLNGSNRGTWYNVSRGITYAVDNGARVINLSLGSAVGSLTLQNALNYATEQGVVVVAAAGNSNSDRLQYPAAYANVVAVSATNPSDARWAASNYGEHIDLSAPGETIYSTVPGAIAGEAAYAYISGTSMAAPHVAALAGLLFSQVPERTGAQVIDVMLSSAKDLGEIGADRYYGVGRIDVLAALQVAAPPVATTPPDDGEEPIEEEPGGNNGGTDDSDPGDSDPGDSDPGAGETDPNAPTAFVYIAFAAR